MVGAHRDIVSKLPKGHWLFRLCFEPAQRLGYPPFMPRIADCLGCTAFYCNSGGGNSQCGFLESKFVIGRLGGRDHREQRLGR